MGRRPSSFPRTTDGKGRAELGISPVIKVSTRDEILRGNILLRPKNLTPVIFLNGSPRNFITGGINHGTLYKNVATPL